MSTLFALFAGFLIKPENFPSFWTFVYWLNPLHYALEAITVTQFNKDATVISITGTLESMTASSFVQLFFTEWKYSHRGYDVLALLLFILVLRYTAQGLGYAALLIFVFLLSYALFEIHTLVLTSYFICHHCFHTC